MAQTYDIQQIGLTGSNYSYNNGIANVQSSTAYGLNDAGQASGYSERFNSAGTSLGYDSWVFNGTTTQEIGLTGTNYSYTVTAGTYQDSQTLAINNAGQVVGFSDRFSSTGTSLGYDSWFFNGTTTQQIGLTGGNYSYNNGSGIYERSYYSFLPPHARRLGRRAKYDPTAEMSQKLVGSGTAVISRPHPSAIDPTSPETGSIAYSDQVPFGSIPSNVVSRVNAPKIAGLL